MSLESYFEKLFDKSAPMRALRKSSRKAWILGILDAMQAPESAAEVIAGELNGEAGEVNQIPGKEPAASPVALPRPQLLGIAAKHDEPDKPGVPPKRVRKKPRGQGAPEAGERNGEAHGPLPPPETQAEGEKP